MKLLIITQAVDRNDPILGFFHTWLHEYPAQCEKLTVIGQRVGSYNLPANVMVHSLCKEDGRPIWRQILCCLRVLWQCRHDYDAVLVHMTPIWIVIAAPLLWLLRKQMYLWYEIKRGSWKLQVALKCVRRVFSATTHGLPEVTLKQVVVGHGIDTTHFAPQPSKREPGHLLAVGRVTRIKHYEEIFQVVSSLPETTLTVAGGTITPDDTVYQRELQDLLHDLELTDRVCIDWVSPEELPGLMQRADVMLHASQGGLDKVVLQAMACGCPVVSTSEAAQAVLPSECQATSESFARVTQQVLQLSLEQRANLGEDLRRRVERDHSLVQCIERQVAHMTA